ncbi:MAG: hypothetical protein ACRDAI_05645 [Candidatus Rhabdochlamydia sp.]
MAHPIVIQEDLGLIEGINQAGRSIGGALEKRFDSQKQREGGNILQSALQELEHNPNPLALQSVMTKALAAGAPPELVQNMGSLYSALQQSQPKSPLHITKPGELSEVLQQFGVETGLADKYDALYPRLTTGGQTAFANILFDQIQRNGSLTTPSNNQMPPGPATQVPNQGINASKEPFKWPKVNPFSDLTNREKVSRGNEFFKENTKLFNAAAKNLNSHKSEGLTIRQLKSLNDSSKLPSGKTKVFNVDLKTGELRIIAAANAETQLFVKNINRFLSNAQQFFGGRVTNFEVMQYKQGLPTLANSPEGRRLILEQMEIENELKQLDEQSIKETIGKYGTRGIDPAEAQIISEQWKQQKEEELLKRFDRVSLAATIFVEKKLTNEEDVLGERKGKRGYLPKSEITKFEKRGGRIL